MDMKRGVQLIALLGLILAVVFMQHLWYLKNVLGRNAAGQEVLIEDEEPKLEGIDYSEFYMKEDTVELPNPSGYTFRVYQNQVNQMVDSFPELFQEQMLKPNEAYDHAWKRNIVKCLADEDQFYIQYYYLMRKRNGEGFWTEPREKLQTILMLLNDLSLCEAISGSYHGHEISHILAKTEYEIYLLKSKPHLLHEHYNMNAQIHLYIETLRQWVRDVNNHQIDYEGAERIQREKEFQVIVDKLERTITNGYYLDHAREYFDDWLRND